MTALLDFLDHDQNQQSQQLSFLNPSNQSINSLRPREQTTPPYSPNPRPIRTTTTTTNNNNPISKVQHHHPRTTSQSHQTSSSSSRRSPKTNIIHLSNRRSRDPTSSSSSVSSSPSTSKTPRRIKKPDLTIATTAADRMAAAVMEGAPDTHWNSISLSDQQQDIPIVSPTQAPVTHPTIRRSSVLEELIRPIQPLISNTDHDLRSSQDRSDLHPTTRLDDQSDLPISSIDQTNQAKTKRLIEMINHKPIPSFDYPTSSSNFITPARVPQTQKGVGVGSRIDEPELTPNSISDLLDDLNPLPEPHRPSDLRSFKKLSKIDELDHLTRDDSLDQRVTELLSHIKSDQVEKANLAIALSEARSEVSALRDEVHLLRIGVQKLTHDHKLGGVDQVKRRDSDDDERRTNVGDRNEIDHHPELEKELKDLLRSHHRTRTIDSSYQRLKSNLDLTRHLLDPNHQDQEQRHQMKSVSLPDLLNARVGRPTLSRPMTSNLVPGSNPETRRGQERADRDPSPSSTSQRNREKKVMKGESKIQIEGPNLLELSKKFLGDLALSVSFTRSIDELINGNQKNRNDDEIFNLDHLEGLVARVRVWKGLARRDLRHHLSG